MQSSSGTRSVLAQNETDKHLSPPAPLIPSPATPLIVNPEMCYFCFDVIIAHLYKQHVGYIPSFTNTSYPLFVTWKIGHDYKLRGCIGTFDPLPLHRGLLDYTIKSAMEDNRFQPVTLSEIPKMNCSVSLLINFESGKHYLDWEVGVHGITIEFNDNHKKLLRATYLPEVAFEQGWSKEEAIRSLMKKAGLKSSITQEIVDTISLTRYNSQKYSVTYREYIDLWYNRRS